MTAIGRAVAAGATANLAMGTLFAWSLMAEQAAADVGATSTTTSAIFATAIATFAVALLAVGRLDRGKPCHGVCGRWCRRRSPTPRPARTPIRRRAPDRESPKADPTVWPWLSKAMANTTHDGTDGTDQFFGIPSASQDWGGQAGVDDRPGTGIHQPVNGVRVGGR